MQLGADLGSTQLNSTELNSLHLNTIEPTTLSILSPCVPLDADAAQQRLRRCISLGGACGATIFQPRRLRRRHWHHAAHHQAQARLQRKLHRGLSLNASALMDGGGGLGDDIQLFPLILTLIGISAPSEASKNS